MTEFLHRIYEKMRSPRGRDAGMFILFLFISSILWIVLSLNEEEQQDIRMPLKFVHVPDSVTLISRGPDALSVSLRAKGTQLMKMTIGSTPAVEIDFRAYSSNGAIKVSNADLKALVRNASGGAQVNVVYPDTLYLPYTTHAGYSMPVVADYRATAGPQAALQGKPVITPDSVKIYFADGIALPDNLKSITTEPIRLVALEKTTVVRARLIGIPHSRIIPDSVDVVFNVEPMIFKSRKVAIEPVNVPHDIKLITFPAQVETFFMVPMSKYTAGATNFRVVADYSTINPLSRKVKLALSDVPGQLYNVQLSADSAEYIIERR